MSKNTLVWALFLLGVIMVGGVMYQASTQMSSVEGSSFKTLVGAVGLVFIAYCLFKRKGTDQVAIEAGLTLGQRSRRDKHEAKTSSPPKPAAPPAPPEPAAPAKPKRPPMRQRAVFLYRKPRAEGDVKTGGTSWLGGLPALGDVAWPRDKSGQVMHHVMQVDLEEAGPFLDVPGLPMSGSLSVFVALGEDTTFETKVCYVPQATTETMPPEPLAPIHDHTYGGMLVRGGDPMELGTLPRWSVDLVRLEVDEEDGMRDALDAIAPLGTGMNAGTFTFKDHLPNGQEPSYWHSAQLFARSLDRAIRDQVGQKLFSGMAQKSEDTLARYELNGYPKRPNGPSEREIKKNLMAEIDKYRGFARRAQTLKPEMERAAAEIMGWAFAHEPWEMLTPSDLETFRAYFDPFKFPKHGTDAYIMYKCSSDSYTHLGGLADATLKEMMRGPDAVFGLLPDVVQAATDTDHHTPGMPHQMFGPPAWIQDSAAFHEDDHLLFQIVHDDLIGLRLGDVGHIQVWISPDDLAAGNWDAITSTFECS